MIVLLVVRIGAAGYKVLIMVRRVVAGKLSDVI